MAKYVLMFIPLFFLACGNLKEMEEEGKAATFNFVYEDHQDENLSCIQGRLYDQNGKGLFFARITVFDTLGVIHGVMKTDYQGAYKLCVPVEGSINFKADYNGISSQAVPMELINGKTLLFSDSLKTTLELDSKEEPRNELLKPLIYLYPVKDTKVKVEVAIKDGKLKHCYPRYEKGWKVKAKSDGTLKDKKGRSYYGLYWEADVYREMSFSNASLVAKENLIQFLEGSLDALGLTEREANEFIMFWLPRLEENDYNLIHFSTEEYKKLVPLRVKPEPDQQIRIMMLYTPATKNTLFPIQLIKRVERKKDAFVLVEWGGAKIEHPLKNTGATEGKGSIFKNM